MRPTRLTLRHAFLYLQQQLNYHCHFIISALYCLAVRVWALKTSSRDVVQLLMNCTLATLTTARSLDPENPRAGAAISMDLSGFGFPLLPGKYDNRLVIECTVKRVDVQTAGEGTGEEQRTAERANNAKQQAKAQKQADSESTKANSAAVDKSGTSKNKEQPPTTRKSSTDGSSSSNTERPLSVTAMQRLMAQCPFLSWPNALRYAASFIPFLRSYVRPVAPSFPEDAQYTYTVSRFDFNALAITDPAEQLNILGLVAALLSHPQIHSFFDSLYLSQGTCPDAATAKQYDDLFLHGQYLNEISTDWPGRTLGQPQWLDEFVHHNAQLPLQPHSHTTLAALLPFSPFLRFLLPARRLMHRFCQQHSVPFSAELLFLSSILHSSDHHSLGAHLRWHRLVAPHFPAGTGSHFNFFAVFFCSPSQYFLTNLLRDKAHKTPFYADLYASLYALEPEYADCVTLSITY